MQLHRARDGEVGGESGFANLPAAPSSDGSRWIRRVDRERGCAGQAGRNGNRHRKPFNPITGEITMAECVKEFTEDEKTEMFEYLDALRESGATNMYGAAPYLVKEFGINQRLAVN